MNSALRITSNCYVFTVFCVKRVCRRSKIWVQKCIMRERQYYCERYREIAQEELLIISSIWVRFSNFKKRWKGLVVSFPTLFESSKTDTTRESYVRFNFPRILTTIDYLANTLYYVFSPYVPRLSLCARVFLRSGRRRRGRRPPRTRWTPRPTRGTQR